MSYPGAETTRERGPRTGLWPTWPGQLQSAHSLGLAPELLITEPSRPTGSST
ncbi:hypothetical protein BD414DRAFT_474095 [Trametes punicea]|nr:hypothetical protein BD414DRAFT_474095 [Trametes punicea]